MSRSAVIAPIVSAGLALAGGYWWGAQSTPHAASAPASTNAQINHKSSPDPHEILYYRHPMGLPDTSPLPKKDPMGMDYVPVYANEMPTGPGFVIPEDKLQRVGIRTAEAGPRALTRTVRAVGTVQVDERRQAAVSPKFEGYVTRLRVATTGAPVRRGDPLVEVYSPELVSAQEEYLVARHNLTALGDSAPEIRTRLEGLLEASRTRLQNWDIEQRDLADIDAGRVQKSVLLRSPVEGVVLEKMARVGQRFMAGEALYQVAGLETVWLVANVFEQDLDALAASQQARATFEAYPGRVFEGKVAFVYPTLEAETRTLAVRVELRNRERLLKPGLYGTVQIAAPKIDVKVAVPESAVLDSGTRRLIFVAHEGGRFETREVQLGAHGDGYVAITRGLSPGESIVADGNFLIDAESNLRAGTGSFGHTHGDAQSAGESAAPAKSLESAPAHDGHSGH